MLRSTVSTVVPGRPPYRARGTAGRLSPPVHRLRRRGLVEQGSHFRTDFRYRPAFFSFHGLATDPAQLDRSGGIEMTAEPAERYGFTDTDGSVPPVSAGIG